MFLILTKLTKISKYKALRLSGDCTCISYHLAIVKYYPFRRQLWFIPHGHISEMNDLNV